MIRVLTTLIVIFHMESAFAQQPLTVQEVGEIGCRSMDDWRRVEILISQGDRDALVKFMTEKLPKEECIFLEPGSRVYQEQVDQATGYVCVRPLGEPYCFWIVGTSVDP